MVMLRYFITSKAKRNLLKFFFTNEGGSFYTRQVSRLTAEPLNAVRRELTYLEKAGLLESHMQGNQKYYSVVQSFPLLAEWKRIILLSEPEAGLTARDAAGAPPAGAGSISKAGNVLPGVEDETAPIIPDAMVVMHRRPELSGEKQKEAPAAGGRARRHAVITATADFVEYLRTQINDVNSIALAVIYGAAAMSDAIPEAGVDLLVVGDINQDALLELVANIEDATGVGTGVTRMTRSDFDYRSAKGDPLIRRIWGSKKLVVKGKQTDR